jgi:hypothetical protein
MFLKSTRHGPSVSVDTKVTGKTAAVGTGDQVLKCAGDSALLLVNGTCVVLQHWVFAGSIATATNMQA